VNLKCWFTILTYCLKYWFREYAQTCSIYLLGESLNNAQEFNLFFAITSDTEQPIRSEPNLGYPVLYYTAHSENDYNYRVLQEDVSECKLAVPIIQRQRFNTGN
jgi:hypothetical protein